MIAGLLGDRAWNLFILMLIFSFVSLRFRCIVPYPPNSEYELALKVGDVVFVHKKREDGW